MKLKTLHTIADSLIVYLAVVKLPMSLQVPAGRRESAMKYIFCQIAINITNALSTRARFFNGVRVFLF